MGSVDIVLGPALTVPVKAGRGDSRHRIHMHAHKKTIPIESSINKAFGLVDDAIV